MKKLSIVLCFLLIFIMSISSVSANVGVLIDGKDVLFDSNIGYPFVDSSNRTQVPLRATMEAFGCTVEWDETNFCATVKKDDTVLTVPVGKNYILKNGKKIQNDTASLLKDGRIYLPIRVVFESLGAYVNWDSRLNSVTADTSSELMQIHFIDVGQGDCSFIDLGTYEVLIDAGDNTKGDVVCQYINPYVDGNLELVIATHPDADHIGGIDTVLKNYTVDKVIDSGYTTDTKTYSDYINAVKTEGCILEYDFDTNISLGNGATLNILETGDQWTNSNDMSVVSMLTYGNTEVLFTGDISQDVEFTLLGRLNNIDVLKVAHHGSKTSTSDMFLEAVKPNYAIVSAGKNNRYGHPTKEALDRLNYYGTKVLGTYMSGSIVLNVNMSSYGFNKSSFITTQSFMEDNNDGIQYVGNKNSLIFHINTCSSVKNMKEENKVSFLLKEDAVKNGYTPCKKCKP